MFYICFINYNIAQRNIKEEICRRFRGVNIELYQHGSWPIRVQNLQILYYKRIYKLIHNNRRLGLVLLRRQLVAELNELKGKWQYILLFSHLKKLLRVYIILFYHFFISCLLLQIFWSKGMKCPPFAFTLASIGFGSHFSPKWIAIDSHKIAEYY
jgi:preprotein translocase subunit SecG